MAKTTEKLTSRMLERLSRELGPSDEVWDSELAGYHVRAGQRGLSLRVSYYNAAQKRRVLTLGRYGELTATQARDAAREALAVVAQGGDPRAALEDAKTEAIQQQQQTLGVYLRGDYADYQCRRKDGSATRRRIEGHFRDWLDRPMSSLGRNDVERWQSKMEIGDPDAEPPVEPLAYTTLTRSYGALQTLLNHAAQREVIPANPLSGVRLQKPALTAEDLEEDEGRRYLDPDEVDRFFAGLNAYQEEKRRQRQNSRAHGKRHLPDLDAVAYVDHVVPWLLTMFYTGFRPGDLMGLRWPHVNFEHATIRKIIEKTAHQSPEPQTFPLSDEVLDVLKAWWDQLGQPRNGYVFASPSTGKRLDRTAMRKPWGKIRELGQLDGGLVLYTLRHNFASQLVMAGVDLLTVSKLMAHSDIQTTIKYYAHLQPDHKRQAAQLFAQIGRGGRRNGAAHEAARTDASAVLA